jgi:hypothetical protein
MDLVITATASGSLVPPTGTYPDPVTNGDFTITGNPGAVAIGEGVDEETRWVFDFTADPAYAFFSSALGLTSAVLQLTLTPRDTLITTDLVRIDAPGFSAITGPIQVLPVNVTSTIQIDLLAQPSYEASAIAAALTSGSGKIPMVYGDDSIVSAAKLELTQRTPACQYAVKFVCGKSEGRVVAPGQYFTAINVHNPRYRPVRLRKKFAVALPAEKAGPVTRFFNAKLGPDQAFEIDNDDIFRHVDANQPFLKGFAIIESETDLDVVAVYTVAGRDGQIQAFHTERVHPRKAGCECKDTPPPQGRPDLIPVPDASGQFCNISAQGLVVTVRNQGAGPAGASTTRVDFSNGTTVNVPTPPLGPGAQVALPAIPFPPGCFQPDCSFRITVDATGVVAESNEVNNTASGTCIG